MTNGNDVNYLVAIRNAVDDSPLANADAPKIDSALQLHHTRRARVGHQGLHLLEDASGDLRIKVL
jgi:hypothetical protein